MFRQGFPTYRDWVFLIELINVSKDENNKISYPATSRVEGIGPQQYGTKSLLGNKFVDTEEKYDLSKVAEGFSEEGEGGESADEDVAEDGTESGDGEY